MTYIPELKVEVVDLINKGNNLSIEENDVELSSLESAEPVVEVKVTPGQGDYYGKQMVSYRRREPSKFFANIPVVAAIDNLGKTVTGAQVLAVINSYWPGLIDPNDIEPDDLLLTFTLGEVMSKPAHFRFKNSSAAWIGTFSLSVIQRFINLGYIVTNGTVTLDNPSSYTMRSYNADFTPIAGLLNTAGTTGVVSDDLAYLISKGFQGLVLKNATILYNGKTADVTGYKVNTGYSNVLLLKSVGAGDDDVIYVHYNYGQSTFTSISTEGGIPITTEDGRKLVL